MCLNLCTSRLERRWHLWHEFMKEHSHLDAWLQFAEQAVSCPDLSNFTYITAKEELRKFEVSLVSARSLFLGWAKFRAETKSETRLC